MIVTYFELAAEVPQALTAFTVTLPLVVPTLTQITFPVEALVKLAPGGNVH